MTSDLGPWTSESSPRDGLHLFMTQDKVKTPGQVEVIPASRDQSPILANLLELYAHDFSEFYGVELGADGRFGYASLPLYWRVPGRHPFLIRIDGKLAGFVLVKRGSEISDNEKVWDMAEFFVVRAYRRRGVGTQIASEVWRRFPGAWEVRVLRANVAAISFWARAIAAFAGEAIQSVGVEKDGDHWQIFSFESSAGVGRGRA
jgi:predicted acetyltransferase